MAAIIEARETFVQSHLKFKRKFDGINNHYYNIYHCVIFRLSTHSLTMQHGGAFTLYQARIVIVKFS